MKLEIVIFVVYNNIMICYQLLYAWLIYMIYIMRSNKFRLNIVACNELLFSIIACEHYFSHFHHSNNIMQELLLNFIGHKVSFALQCTLVEVSQSIRKIIENFMTFSHDFHDDMHRLVLGASGIQFWQKRCVLRIIAPRLIPARFD